MPYVLWEEEEQGCCVNVKNTQSRCAMFSKRIIICHCPAGCRAAGLLVGFKTSSAGEDPCQVSMIKYQLHLKVSNEDTVF